MGVKTGLLITAIGLAIALHAYRKNKKEQLALQGSSPVSQPQGHSSWGKNAAAALGVAGTAYAGHQYLGGGSSSQAPPQATYISRPTLRDPAAIYHHLVECCVQKKLEQFYPPHQPARLRQIAEGIAASGTLERLANEWDLPDPFALDLVRLALFDIILLVDDSSSMRGGHNLREMRAVCSEVTFAASLFDSNGIEVAFFNSKEKVTRVTNPAAVEALLDRNPPNGRTPMGASLRDKILRPMTLRRAMEGTLQKPQLIMIFTDGASTDIPNDSPPHVIQQTLKELQRTRYGQNSVFFSFSQVGDDKEAIDYLSKLDEDSYIGSCIDVTSSARYETQQIVDALKKDLQGVPPHLQALVRENSNPGSPLWQTLFRVKRLVGAIHPWYDQSDEQGKKQKKRRSWSSSREIDYKPHWSEDPDYISKSTSRLQSRGFEPYPIPAAQPQPASYQQPPSSDPWSQNSFPAPQPYNSTPSYQQPQPASYSAPPQDNYYATAHQPQQYAAGGYNAGYQSGPPSFPSVGASFPQTAPPYPSSAPGFPSANAPYSQPSVPYNQPGYNAYQQPPNYNQGGFVGGFGGK